MTTPATTGTETFVDELLNGTKTMLGKKDSGLSEGQMQRLAVARGLFQFPSTPARRMHLSTQPQDRTRNAGPNAQSWPHRDHRHASACSA